jgi:hypothetical protein
MSKTSKARLIATDFAASLLLAVSIGVVTSLALGSAVLLIAQSGASDTPAPASAARDPS